MVNSQFGGGWGGANDFPSKPLESNLQVFRLRGDIAVATTMSNDKKTGKVRAFKDTAFGFINKFTINVAGSIEFKYFSDNLNSFARISLNKLDWLTLTSADTPSFFTTSVSITDVDKILHVGFSRNTATILYDSISSSAGKNVITILEHFADDTVTFIKEKASFGKIDDATTQYKISASCLC